MPQQIIEDMYDKLYQEKEDYKSRCEKAIEYIKCGLTGDLENDRAYVDENYLLNILQNGSEDNDKN